MYTSVPHVVVVLLTYCYCNQNYYLNILISMCEKFARDHSLTYNIKKMNLIIFRYGKTTDIDPRLFLVGQPIKAVENFR